MSLFTSFNAGVAGMASAQSGINTTAHNLSNTKTAGYTRQQNINKDVYYQTLKVTDKAQLQIGYGTTVATIRQIRDQFLDERYRIEVGHQKFYEIQYNTTQEVEDILGEMEGCEFEDTLGEMWSTVETLSTNPESVTNRELFISQSESFLEKASNVYKALKDYQVNLNGEIKKQVTAINDIGDQIAYYNQKIAKAEASNIENANDYRDERNLLLDKLAEYTPYDYYEDQDGKVSVRINNAPLVDDVTSYHMKCENIKQYDDLGNMIESSPMVTVKWEKSGFGEVYSLDRAFSSEEGTDAGTLPGILTARGKKFATYADIPENPNTDQLNKYNNTTGNCLLEKMEAQFDLMIHKVVTAVNDAFAPNVTADLSAVTNGGTALFDPADTSKKVLDAYNCPVGADDNETIGTEVFVRKSAGERYTVYDVDAPVTVTDADGNTHEVTQKLDDGAGGFTYKLYVYNEEDKTDVGSLYSLQNIIVNDSLKENYSYLPVKGNPAAGQTETYDMNVFPNILAGWRREDTVMDPNYITKYGVDNYYDSMVGFLGTQGNVWKNITENQTKEVESIEDKRQQVSGVSTEEELVSLLTYQHAYNAASRYISTIDAMLQHLIERLG